MRAILIAAALLSPLTCHAETPQSLSPKAQQAFEKYAPGGTLKNRSLAIGDLNGDGITDFVTFTDSPQRIAVFFGMPDGTFAFQEASLDVPGGQPPYSDLEVRSHSIFLHWDAAGGCCSHWFMNLQFKMHLRRLTLIGLESGTVYSEDEDGAPMGIDHGVSANLITGDVIMWSGAGKKRTEDKRRLPELKPVPLKDFSFDAFQTKWSTLIW